MGAQRRKGRSLPEVANVENSFVKECYGQRQPRYQCEKGPPYDGFE